MLTSSSFKFNVQKARSFPTQQISVFSQNSINNNFDVSKRSSIAFNTEHEFKTPSPKLCPIKFRTYRDNIFKRRSQQIEIELPESKQQQQQFQLLPGEPNKKLGSQITIDKLLKSHGYQRQKLQIIEEPQKVSLSPRTIYNCSRTLATETVYKIKPITYKFTSPRTKLQFTDPQQIKIEQRYLNYLKQRYEDEQQYLEREGQNNIREDLQSPATSETYEQMQLFQQEQIQLKSSQQERQEYEEKLRRKIKQIQYNLRKNRVPQTGLQVDNYFSREQLMKKYKEGKTQQTPQTEHYFGSNSQIEEQSKIMMITKSSPHVGKRAKFTERSEYTNSGSTRDQFSIQSFGYLEKLKA